jgi:hypothetical protein
LTTLVTLVGEQPIPNLLPMRALRPEALLLVYTARTEPVARRLGGLAGPETEVAYVKTDAYDIIGIRKVLHGKLAGCVGLLFNLTGGTKPMMLAAHALAAEFDSPFIYLQTEGRPPAEHQSRLCTYCYSEGNLRLESVAALPALLTIDDYLRAHLPGYREEGFSKDERGRINAGGLFEQSVHRALENCVDEIRAGIKPEGVADQIDIDLVVRRGNQVGIIEAKTGTKKAGIDQLATAGGSKYLGTYTARFLVVGGRLRHELKALAHARNIVVVELPGYSEGCPLNHEEAVRLRKVICAGL